MLKMRRNYLTITEHYVKIEMSKKNLIIGFRFDQW